MGRKIKILGVFLLVAAAFILATQIAGQEQASAPFEGWRREGLKAEVDLLRADLDALIIEHNALKLKVENNREAAAFTMAVEVRRHLTLRDANFPVGHTLRDVAGVAHEWTAELQAQLIEAASDAETIYSTVRSP